MKHLVSISLLFLATTFVFSQGCSDAGFCTMGAMRPDQAYSKKINFKLRAIELSQYRGKSTLTPVIHVTNLDFTFAINEKNSFQLKFPYQTVSGNWEKLQVLVTFQ